VETLVGTNLGGYTLTSLLGSGGMGSVYLAEDRTIGQQVAIKVIRNDEEDFSDSASAGRAEERFKQEARAVASLDHLHILPLYRYGEEETASGTRAYMVMQYRPEGSLGDWLRRRAGTATSLSMAPKLPPDLPNTWPLSVAEAGDYLLQAASALQYAHEQGIIHRDVKPANFLLRYDSRVASGTGKIFLLLSDFGLARFFSAVSGTSHVLGTPTYMAPEQFDGIAGPESDQYALAIMVYYLLAGRPPFQGDPLYLMHQHLSAEPPPIRAANPAIASGVENVLARALAKQPAQRYPSIAAFAEDFIQRMYEGATPRRLTLPTAPNNSGPSFPATIAPLMNGVPTASASSGGITHNTPSQALAPTVNLQSGAQSLHTQRPISLLQPLQAATLPIEPQDSQDVPHKQRVSRRSALAWIIGGTAVASLGIGSGIYFYANQQPSQVKSVLSGHSSEVTALSWSPDGAQLASSSRDHTVRLWNASNQSTLVYKGHAAAVQAVVWNLQGTLLASGGRDNQAQIWNPAGNTLYRSSLLASAISALAWSTNGDELFIGTAGNGLHRFTLANSRTSLEANRAIIHAVAISPDGTFIATGTAGGRVTIARLKGSEAGQIQNYESHLGSVLSLAWSPDSTKLASGGSDKMVRVLSLATASITSTLSHASAVNGLAWEPVSGERLATAASDGTLRIWTPGNNKYTSYDAHAGALTSAAWGGHGLATGSTDAKILIWKV